MLVCLALGFVNALELRLMSVAHGFPLPWSNVFASTTPRWSVLALTLPIALHLGTWPSLRMRRRRLVLTHATLFLAIAWTYAAVMAWSMVYANPIAARFPWNARLLRSFYNSLPILVACYAAVLLASWALHEARERQRRSLRASQLEAQLQSARLAALRARLQPHFLYNTLNGIAALVYDMRRDEAGAAIEQLSELLHASLRDDDRDTVTLSEEIALAEQYLSLQKMRFGDRLTHVTRIESDAGHMQVPVLLLQPLIENAVVHGLEAGQERLQVTILAHVTNEVLEIRVENDGPPVTQATLLEDPNATSTSRSGVGVAATRARLLSACGVEASLELLAPDGGGVVARVRIPHQAMRTSA